MTKEWNLDRKNRQERTSTVSRQKGNNTNIVSYVESYRKKLKSTHSLNRVKTNLRAARAHLKTLTSRANYRERVQTQEKIKSLEARVEELSSGVAREVSEFDSIVQPYLEAVQEMEADSPSSVIPRVKMAGPTRKPKSSFKGDEQCYDRSSIHDELAMVLNDTMPPVLVMKEDMCDTCDVAMVVMASEARMGCPMCSRTKPYMQATSSRIPYGEEVEFATFSYKRQHHFQEWLNAIQAKENTEVSNTVINDVISHIFHKNGIRDSNNITQTMVRSALKSLDLRKQYDHTMQIYVSITGKQPPRFSTFQEEQLRLMFDAIQGPFKKHCPPDRKNFLSYSYCLHKFCELLGYDNFLQYFMLLKGVEKLRKQDAIFSNICEELNWQFIPSYKERDSNPGRSLEEFVQTKPRS